MKLYWNAALKYLLARLTERSTWNGLIGLSTAAGMAIAPKLADHIAVIGAVVASVVLIITGDAKYDAPIEIDSTPEDSELKK
jgi:hypothetical protein